MAWPGYPSYPDFIAFLDANPGKYKNTPEPDGYNPSATIAVDITTRPLIPNPVPQEDIYNDINVPGMQALMSVETLGRISDQWWASVSTAIINQTEERETIVAFIDNADSRGNITTPDEVVALKDYVTGVSPDPTWESQVLGPSDAMTEWSLGGMSVDYIDEALGR